jgi:LacI family transcriptional regulator
MPVTIKDIARESGFSVPTVSQVLNNKGDLYRPQTRDKILKTARRLGYRPNSYRWVLRTGRFNTIGLLVAIDPSRGYVGRGTWCGLARSLAEADMHLTVGHLTGHIDDPPLGIPKIVRERSVDGLLVYADGAVPDEVTELINEHEIPTVWLHRRCDVDCVYLDYRRGLASATDRLIELGHRRIGFFGRARNQVDGKVMFEGYAGAMAAAGLKSRDLRAGRDKPAQRIGADLQRALSGKDRPTAVIAECHDDAMEVMCAAMGAGLVVPEQLSLLCVCESPAQVGPVRLTHVKVDLEAVAEAGVSTLLEKINGAEREHPSRAVAMPLVEADTTAAPGGA